MAVRASVTSVSMNEEEDGTGKSGFLKKTIVNMQVDYKLLIREVKC